MGKAINKEIVNQRLSARGIKLIGDYVDSKTKGVFACSCGNSWSARVRSVVNDGRGCPKCHRKAPLTVGKINERLSSRGISIVGQYKNANSKAKFSSVCGHSWEAKVSHVLDGRGCPSCHRSARLTKDKVNDRIRSRGITLVGQYKNNKTKAEFCCDCGYRWKAFPLNVLKGCGCPSCAVSGFNGGKPGTLYYLRVDSDLYKIGITNLSISERFKPKDLEKIEVLAEWRYESGSDAAKREREILEQFSDYRYRGPDVLSYGNTELFVCDVLCVSSAHTTPKTE